MSDTLPGSEAVTLSEADDDMKPLFVATTTLAVSGDKLPEGEAVSVELIVTVIVTDNDAANDPEDDEDKLAEAVASSDFDFRDDDEELPPPDVVLAVKEIIVEMLGLTVIEALIAVALAAVLPVFVGARELDTVALLVSADTDDTTENVPLALAEPVTVGDLVADVESVTNFDAAIDKDNNGVKLALVEGNEDTDFSTESLLRIEKLIVMLSVALDEPQREKMLEWDAQTDEWPDFDTRGENLTPLNEATILGENNAVSVLVGDEKRLRVCAVVMLWSLLPVGSCNLVAVDDTLARNVLVERLESVEQLDFVIIVVEDDV